MHSGCEHLYFCNAYMILDIFQVVRVLFEFLFLKIFVSLMMVTLVGECSLWIPFLGVHGGGAPVGVSVVVSV